MGRENGSALAFMGRALRYRNYRLFFLGQLVSLVGSWMTTVATSWLVYRLTGSALMLGWIAFAGQFPAFLLAPAAGIFVDRWDKRRLLIVTQTLQMLQSFSLAALTLTGRITLGWLVGLNALEGLVNAFDIPCRQSFVVEMIENKEDLGNAIALNSSLFNSARLLGPAIGGLVIAAAGEGICFLVDGVSFLGVLAALLSMRTGRQAPKVRPRAVSLEFADGFRYAMGSVAIRRLILLIALMSLVGAPYTVLLPILAGRVLGGGPHLLGWLMSAAGLGALAGALWLASRENVLGLGWATAAAGLAFSAALLLLSMARGVPAALALVFFAGLGYMIQMGSANTILQTVVDDDKRGRVMSFFSMAFLGTAPFGSLLAGGLADRVGVGGALGLGGGLCLLGGLWFAKGLPSLRDAVRPIYRRLGILPARAPRPAAELSRTV